VQAILQMKHNFVSIISGGSSVLYLFRVITGLSAWFPKKEKE